MRPVVLLWENFGPYHHDRLGAVAASGREAIGNQFAPVSATYSWSATVDDATVVTLLPKGRSRSPIRLARRIFRECRRIGPAHFFFCHYEQPAVLMAAIALRLCGSRVWTMGDSKFDDYPRLLWREVGKSLYLLPYRGAITASSRSRDYLRFLRFKPQHLALGYDTISVARLRAQADAPPAPDGVGFWEREWIMVARLVPKKNIAFALEIFARWLGETAHPRDLHILGSGPLEDELRALAASLGISERVRFHGFVQTREVSRQLARSLALLMPSVEEQFGLAVIEAQAAGLPVLASPQVGATDLLIDGGRNGFVLPLHSPAGWAASMLLLSEDEPTWRRFAAAARDGAHRGDTARFAEAVAQLTT